MSRHWMERTRSFEGYLVRNTFNFSSVRRSGFAIALFCRINFFNILFPTVDTPQQKSG